MLHTHSTRIYPDSAYDQYLTLKPPLPLWLATWFLARAITLPLCMGVAHVAGVNDAALRVMRQAWSFDFSMVPALAAATLLYLFIRRVPTASQGVRWLWSRGRVLLVTSAILDIAAGSIIGWAREFNDTSLMTCIGMSIDLVIIGYGLVSERVRDTFADFPTP